MGLTFLGSILDRLFVNFLKIQKQYWKSHMDYVLKT